MTKDSAHARSRALGTCGAVLAALDEELDWAALGAAYCDGDARDFFDAAQRENVLETGLQFAQDVVDALPPRGRSVYVGAAVAELAPLLAEALVLEREVVWLNLPGVELDELARALRVVGGRLAVRLPAPSTRALETLEPASCDHMWMVSVLTDPDAFPALHDALYERRATPLATARGDLGEERARADALIDGLLACATRESVLSTTDEELELVCVRAAVRGWSVGVPERGRYTSLVGDVVRMCALRRGA